MNGSPSVRVALFNRECGSKSSCRWLYCLGIYIQFIDASELYKKETNNNVLTDNDDENDLGHIQQIMQMFDRKEDVEHVAKCVAYDAIVQNDYNLSVSSYVEGKDTREVIDIKVLNEEIKSTVEKIDKLRAQIDEIIEVIES